jgi:hypothetical protein
VQLPPGNWFAPPGSNRSGGMGVWVPDGHRIKGKFVEVTADRTTRQFVNRGEISFLIKVNGNAFQRDGERDLLRRHGTTIERTVAGNTGRSTGCTLAARGESASSVK